ncbi:MAG TPA: hypothetical protein P5525_24810, partial [Candidatus Paceibacterota bacterium]|nr:hypothetical protein [Candidatus Paceibacterota bacterium]
QDRGETKDLAATRADLVQQAVELLRREVDENALFPVTIPGVNEKGSGNAVRYGEPWADRIAVLPRIWEPSSTGRLKGPDSTGTDS